MECPNQITIDFHSRCTNVSNIIITEKTSKTILFRKINHDFVLEIGGTETKEVHVRAPIMSRQEVTAANRYGVSLQLIDHFKYRLTHTIRNEQIVRAKWEIEWQTPEQSQKANAYLYELLNNRVSEKNSRIYCKD